MNHAIRMLAYGAIVFSLTQGPALAQAPVDEQGNVIGDFEAAKAGTTGDDGIPLRTGSELQDLVGPIALYPDDLLAVVLPAATYPLQVVQAARFLEDLEADPSLEPDPEWDDSIVALVNYPEVVELMNEDLDWTWELGEAVVAQQEDVIEAIAQFREQAYAAGNLKSDERQTVSRNDDVIEITPVSEEVIYVPYYEPSRVVVYQPRPVYYYYPHSYPVYYYPYPYGYSFASGYFWGVTTAFTIGWTNHRLRVYHHSYLGHPYYGHHYWETWWYRRPPIHVYNNVYVNNGYPGYPPVSHHYEGDAWRPAGYTRLRHGDQRITRNRYYPNPATAGSTAASRNNGSVSSRVTRSVGSAGLSSSDRRAAGSVNDMRRAISANDRIRAAADANRTAPQPAGAGLRRGGDSVSRMREALGESRNRQTVTSVSRPDQATRTPSARSPLPEQRSNIVQPRTPLRRAPSPALSSPERRSSPAPAYRAPQPPGRSNPPASSPSRQSVQRPAPDRAASPPAARPDSRGTRTTREAPGARHR
jgi:hypothetical protein